MGLAPKYRHGHVVRVKTLASFPRPDLGTTSHQQVLAKWHSKPGRAPLAPTPVR